ncbi:MAG TPA: energy-coupled thiamine transporter ThiT [Candidatus Faeciplasma avium]|uniref:Energy-coupled thiamine transporter ThiT n=1 Tax=Candidatus Faeciplasma avium TaxID=2840798 RepID=A0A9D1T3Y0_9FIRM|nr:energy-coupled thiamine transporter ThiT [Candidatus Faeciplasma avium]
MKTSSKTLALTESAVMVALAFVLSFLKVVDMPYGGSVTAFSMLPIVIIAYRHRLGWGLASALAYSLLQMLMGLNNLSYATSAAAAVAIILLDYIVAFLVLGLAGVFRKNPAKQPSEIALGALLGCILRYACHVIAGCTVWAGVSIPTSDGLIYSLGYNATYMIPETLLTVVGAYYAGQVLTLGEPRVTRRQAVSGSGSTAIASMPAALAVVIASAFVFGMMQNPDSGSFDITLVAQAGLMDWLPVLLVLVLGAAVSAALAVVLPKKAK